MIIENALIELLLLVFLGSPSTVGQNAHFAIILEYSIIEPQISPKIHKNGPLEVANFTLYHLKGIKSIF